MTNPASSESAARDAVVRDADDTHGLRVRAMHVRAVRADAREVDAVASTEAVDSYGEIVRANWDLKRFLDNPIILWAHNRFEDRLPVGRAKNVRVEEGQLLMTVVFDAVTQFDEHVFQKYVAGTLKGFSVGFNPRTVRIEKRDGQEVVVLDDNELFEVSCVPIPSNPEALARARTRAIEAARAAAAPAQAPAPAPAPAEPPPPASPPAGPAPTPAPVVPPPAAPARAEPARSTPHKPQGNAMKDGKIKKAGDVACTVECPHCTEDFELSVDILPVPAKKLAELTEERSLRAAAEARAKAFEAREVELSGQLLSVRTELATVAVDALLGVKLFPAERDTQMELARLYLGQKDGEAKWAKHLESLRARPDIQYAGPPVAGQDPTPPTVGRVERGTHTAPGGSGFAQRVARGASPDE